MSTDTGSWTDIWHPTSDGLQIHARDYPGPAGAMPVVCLHGLTRNAADFANLAAHLQCRYRVIVVEQRGRGRSDYDPQPERYQLGQYVDDTRGLLQALEVERPVLVGTSMGGLMSLLMLATDPDGYRGAVLNDIGPVVEADGLRRIQGYVGQGRPAESWEEAIATTREIHADAFPDFTDADWQAFTERLYRRDEQGRLVPDYDPAIAQPLTASEDAATPPDLWSVFEASGAVPMLIIRGTRSDILSAATLREMCDRKPDARSLELTRIGHAPTLDEAPARQALDAFLAECAQR